MEIEHIHEFVNLAETKSFAETADRLFTSQSTISKHLKTVEAELGVQLFDRTSRHVRLNEYGELFLPFARNILQTQYEYTTAFYNRLELSRKMINIGSIPGMAQYGITDILIQFKKENENFKLNVIEAESMELIQMLLEHKIELAFLRDSALLDKRFIKIPYCSDHLVAMLPASHPMAQEHQLHLPELKDDDYILIKEKTFMYDLCMNACNEAGFTPNVTFTGHHLDNIIDLVLKGMGISLLMKRQTLNIPSDKLKVIDIVPPITNQLVIAYRSDTELSFIAKHFLKCVNLS